MMGGGKKERKLNWMRMLLFLVLLSGAWPAAAQFDAEDPFEAGKKLFGEQKYTEALAKFQETLKWIPDDPTVLSWIAATHVQLSQFPEAEKSIQAAIANGGTSYQFYEMLTVSQVRQSKWDEALATIGKYRKIAPEAELKTNEPKLRAVEAALHLEKRGECLRRDPPDRDCADAEAEAAWNLGVNDPAQHAQFTQIWLIRGANTTDPAKKAEMYARAEKAARAWVGSAQPADAVRAKAALGTALVRQKKYDDAIPLLEEARRAEPTNCAILLELTRIHLAKEDYAAAKSTSSELATCRPDDPQPYLLRAMAEQGLGDCPAVIKDGAEYMKRAPGKEEPKFVTYCKQMAEWEKNESKRQKQLEDYKKWVKQQLESGPDLE